MAAYSAALLALLATASQAAVLRDVPLGECYQCEVTCFEDCALKYDREIIQMDLLQVKAATGKKNHTEQLTEQFGDCLKEDKCPCPKEAAKEKKSLKLLAAEKKKKGKCAVGQMSCSGKCGQKVIAKDQASMTAAPKKALLQKKDFPLHAVKINVFAKGAMNLDTCLKYCLSATCGCDGAVGFDSPGAFAKAVKANAAVSGVADTPKSPKYRPAKIEECAKGMIGKKVASDLFIKIDGGPGGMYEICSMPMLKKILGPSGDFDGYTAKCKSAASDDVKYGCSWDSEKGKCIVGFSPILTCQVEYFTDPTF